MITEFLEHLISIGAMSPPDKEIVIEWPDVTEPTVKDKLELGKMMTEINERDLKAGGSGDIFSAEEIRDAAGYEMELSSDGDPLDGYSEGTEQE